MKKYFTFTIEVPSDNYTYALPLMDVSGYKHNFIVNWGDGTKSQVSAYNDPNRIHVYSTAGEYQVKIGGQCPGFEENTFAQRCIYKSIDSWGDVGLRHIAFYKCCNLGSLPKDSQGLKEVEKFYLFLAGCVSLTSIPEDLFKYNTEAKDFNCCLHGCTGLTSIPENLFKYNTGAISFSNSFYGCKNLTSIPENLFKYNTEAKDFYQCFKNCKNLKTNTFLIISLNIFREITENQNE